MAPAFTCDNCTHNQILAKRVSSLPDGSLVPVVILFHGQPSVDDIKSHKQIDYAGDIELLRSYGGNVTKTWDLIHGAAANIPKDKVLALANDPRITSVDLDYPSCMIPEGCTAKNSTQPLHPSIDSKDVNVILMSPLKQFKSGVLSQDVKCRDNLTLIIQEQNERPSCVKPTSLTRLLSHGWVTLEKFESVNNINATSKSESVLEQNKSDTQVSGLSTPRSDMGKIVSKTSNDGVITIRSQNLCVPLRHVITDGITDKTTINVLSIRFPTSGQVSLHGITSLSSSKKTTLTPVSSGNLVASYNLEKNSTIVNCGISYCKGDNCNPDKELPTINVSIFVNNTKGYCPTNPLLGMACRGPFASTDASISTNSPSMESGVPYLYKFYIVDSLGKYEEWFFALEYHPQ